jgi:prophage DNA circulation protein
MAWLDDIADASFRGVAFQVEKPSQRGGRRLANHQYPLRDRPNSEDMGSKQRQYSFDAYVLGVADAFAQRDALIVALDAGGSGLLIHPTYGQLQVMVDDWTETTDLIKEQNICRFKLSFLDSGNSVVTTPTTDTAQVSASAADDATSANATSFTSSTSGTWA